MDLRSSAYTMLISMTLLLALAADLPATECKPTGRDMLGPFYEPNAPLRSSVGKGYVLQGIVRSAKDCSPVAGATVEFWLAGPDGEYDDAHRATVRTDADGAYRFESNVPEPYAFRSPHIHVRVSAEGLKTLVTQHYPGPGRSGAEFDLVLIPAR
jgi:protocatechuate 3,4-dioxygenase beta subunit